MIIGNNKPLALIGYAESITVKELEFVLRKEYTDKELTIVDPETFLLNPDNQYQYLNLAVRQDFVIRKQITAALNENKLDRFSYIHPSAQVYLDAVDMAPGVVLAPQSGLQFGVKVDHDVIVLGLTGVAHGCHIGEGTYISGMTALGGSVTIGKFCFLGMRSTVYDKVSICDDVVISATSTVRKNITEPGVYHGSPALKTRLKR